MSLVKRSPLAVTDLLEGCRHLIGSGYKAEAYFPLIEEILNRFFFKPNSEPFEHLAERKYGTSPEQAAEVKQYLEREIHLRVQRIFGLLYPNRQYDYVWEPELHCIVIREFEPSEVVQPFSQEAAHAPTNDISDDWIPERQRR